MLPFVKIMLRCFSYPNIAGFVITMNFCIIPLATSFLTLVLTALVLMPTVEPIVL